MTTQELKTYISTSYAEKLETSDGCCESVLFESHLLTGGNRIDAGGRSELRLRQPGGVGQPQRRR